MLEGSKDGNQQPRTQEETTFSHKYITNK